MTASIILAMVALGSVLVFLAVTCKAVDENTLVTSISKKTFKTLALIVLVISVSNLILGAHLERRSAQAKAAAGGIKTSIIDPGNRVSGN
jgi:hypothetical protein